MWCRETDMNYFGGVRTFKRGRKQICCFGFVFWWEFFFQFFLDTVFRFFNLLGSYRRVQRFKNVVYWIRKDHTRYRGKFVPYTTIFWSYGTIGAGGIRAGVFFLLLVDGNGVGPASAFKHHRVASEVIAVHVQPCGLFRLNFFSTSGLDSPDLDALGGWNVQIGQLRCRRRPG